MHNIGAKIILFYSSFYFSDSATVKFPENTPPIDRSARQSSGFLSGHCSSDRQPQPMVIAMLLLWNPICVSSIMNYGQIFVSMAQLLKQEKRLLLRALAGGFAFAAVSILYSTIALLLSSAHHLPDLVIGMVSLVSIFGALSTQYIGRYADQGYTRQLTWMGCALFIISWICFYYGQTVLISYIVGFALIQLALALVHTSNQSIIFRLRPDAKSRINAIYMTAYFTGGACGSALGIFAWNHGGWSMACLAGVCLVLACMLFSLLDNLLITDVTQQPF